MKKFILIGSVLFSSFALAENLTKNNNLELAELGEPISILPGVYILGGLGYDLVSNKYEFTKTKCTFKHPTTDKNTGKKIDLDLTTDTNTITPKTGTASTRNLSAFIGIGCGGLFEDKYYLGLDLEISTRFGGNEKIKECSFSSSYNGKDPNSGENILFENKNNTEIVIKNKHSVGLAVKARLGYVIPGSKYMPYAVIGFDRFQHSFKAKANKIDSEFVTYGSFYPLVGVGLERFLKNKWSVRGELLYSIGNWDDTGKKIINKDENCQRITKFKAKGNRFSFKVMLSKYI